jgi:selenocysteine lyase/cysteine desulfurase
MTIDRRTFVASAAAMAAIRPGGATFPDDDPLGVRADFPIVASRTFLNGAYITPSPAPAIAAARAFVEARARPMLVGDLLRKSGEVRGQFARLVNATPEEVGFAFATTEGENIVANSVPMQPGDNVVIDDLCYDGALVVHRELEKRRGVELRIVPHQDGAVTADEIAKRVDRRTRLVSVSWVSHRNGWRHDLRALADIAHAHGALLHTDAIQGIGTLQLDVRAADVDFLCAGTYKGMLAGFGIAPFYMKRELLGRLAPDRFGIFGVAKELPGHRFEVDPTAGRYNYATLPFAEVHHLGAALGYLERVGVPRIQEHVLGLAKRLQEGLLAQGFRLFTPAGTRSSIVSFYCTKPMAEVQAAFDAAAVDVTVREGHVRASTAIFNNAAEVDRLLEVTRKLA